MEEIKKVDDNGTTCYYNENGELHRDGDKPAVIGLYGTDEYWVNGVEYFPYGSKEYWLNGVGYFPSESKKQNPKSVWEKIKMLFNIC